MVYVLVVAAAAALQQQQIHRYVNAIKDIKVQIAINV
jgi:hypothetical protein